MGFNYNELFLDHFQKPRNIGRLEVYNAESESENETDSDKIRFFLHIKKDIIEDISYQVKGCPRIIASCSYISEKVKDMSIDDIEYIDKISIREDLGFSDHEFLCIDLPLDTIKDAIKEYRKE